MLMIITRIEWVYLVERVEHQHLKDADVVTKGVEPLDADLEAQDAASHQGVDKIPDVVKALRDATALVADMSQQLNLDPDVEALAPVADAVPAPDTVADAALAPEDAEVPETPALFVTQ
jgi:hypothetical protein